MEDNAEIAVDNRRKTFETQQLNSPILWMELTPLLQWPPSPQMTSAAESCKTVIKVGSVKKETCAEPSPFPIFGVVSGFTVCQEILRLKQNQRQNTQIFTSPITQISVLEYCKKWYAKHIWCNTFVCTICSAVFDCSKWSHVFVTPTYYFLSRASNRMTLTWFSIFVSHKINVNWIDEKFHYNIIKVKIGMSIICLYQPRGQCF
jgi:hypothetical protein